MKSATISVKPELTLMLTNYYKSPCLSVIITKIPSTLVKSQFPPVDTEAKCQGAARPAQRQHGQQRSPLAQGWEWMLPWGKHTKGWEKPWGNPRKMFYKWLTFHIYLGLRDGISCCLIGSFQRSRKYYHERCCLKQETWGVDSVHQGK